MTFYVLRCKTWPRQECKSSIPIFLNNFFTHLLFNAQLRITNDIPILQKTVFSCILWWRKVVKLSVIKFVHWEQNKIQNCAINTMKIVYKFCERLVIIRLPIIYQTLKNFRKSSRGFWPVNRENSPDFFYKFSFENIGNKLN